MEDHVPGVVVESQVVLGQRGLASVEGSLVTKSIGTMSHGGSQVNNGTENNILVFYLINKNGLLHLLLKNQLNCGKGYLQSEHLEWCMINHHLNVKKILK